MDDIEAIKKLPLFAGVEEQDFERLSKAISYKTFKAGETLFSEGKDGAALYIILEGAVRLFRDVREGEEQTLAILKEGKFFGEMSFFEKGGHTATASSLRDTRLAVIDRDAFDSLSKENPKLGYFLLRRIALAVCEILRDMDQKMIDMIKYVWEFGAKT